MKQEFFEFMDDYRIPLNDFTQEQKEHIRHYCSEKRPFKTLDDIAEELNMDSNDLFFIKNVPYVSIEVVLGR